MSQREIMVYLIDQIKTNLEKAVTSDIEVAYGGENKNKTNLILLEIVNLRRLGQQANGPRMKKKIVLGGENKEVFVKQPLPMELVIKIIPVGESTLESLRLAGLIEQVLEDCREIDPGVYDWAGNNGDSIILEPGESSGSGLERVYCMHFGIELDYTEEIKRVEERKFGAVKKKDKI